MITPDMSGVQKAAAKVQAAYNFLRQRRPLHVHPLSLD